ncbi:hypothetical protein [Parasphingorhabdus pacifica]
MRSASNEHLRRRLTEWFPLLPRPRPTCRALPLRVEEVAQLAHAAAHGPDEQRLVSAAEAHNKAALLLSDCGLADRAHQLCWRQFDLFHAHAPLGPKTAKLALQPLVNFGRLHIRNGQGTRAHQLFTNAYQALRTKTATRTDNRNIDLNELVDGQDGRRELLRFLWTVLLSDGTRALTRAGRWDEALEHIKNHKGIGERMLDGRQVAIITRIVSGDYDQALDLLEHSSTPELWEQAVAACLSTLCLTIAGRNMRPSGTTMVDRYLELTKQPTPPVFQCRLGLCALDLTDHAPIVTEITRHAITSADAYAAHDVLAHPACAQGISEADRQALANILSTAGLHHGTETPTGLLNELMDAVAISEANLTHELTQRTEVSEHHVGGEKAISG